MKPVRLGLANTSAQITQAFRAIEDASREERFVDVAMGFTVTNVTETRSLDADTATAADIADFLGTLVLDLQRGRRNNP